MTHIAGHDRSQTLLLPESLDEYVGPENPVRFIEAFVDGLDLTAAGFIRVAPKRTGRPGYAPQDLLKLYIYGYLNRGRPTRRPEAEPYTFPPSFRIGRAWAFIREASALASYHHSQTPDSHAYFRHRRGRVGRGCRTLLARFPGKPLLLAPPAPVSRRPGIACRCPRPARLRRDGPSGGGRGVSERTPHGRYDRDVRRAWHAAAAAGRA